VHQRVPCARPRAPTADPHNASSTPSGIGSRLSYQAAPDIVNARLTEMLEPYDEGDRTERLVADLHEQAVAELSGHVGVSEPRVQAYDDPFAVEGMEEAKD
jgi:hypothetical protein